MDFTTKNSGLKIFALCALMLATAGCSNKFFADDAKTQATEVENPGSGGKAPRPGDTMSRPDMGQPASGGAAAEIIPLPAVTTVNLRLNNTQEITKISLVLDICMLGQLTAQNPELLPQSSVSCELQTIALQPDAPVQLKFTKVPLNSADQPFLLALRIRPSENNLVHIGGASYQLEQGDTALQLILPTATPIADGKDFVLNRTLSKTDLFVNPPEGNTPPPVGTVYRLKSGR